MIMDPFNLPPRRKSRSVYTNSSSRSQFESTIYPRVSRTSIRKPKHEHNHHYDNDLALLHLLKEFSFNTPSFNQRTTLTHTILHNTPNLLTYLLTNPLPTNPLPPPTYLTHLLHLSISHGQKSCIPILLAHGADINGPNTHGISPLQASIREKGSKESIAIMLIEAGADVTTGSPMHWAARRDWAGVIEALWERGVDIDAPSSSNPAITRARNYDIDTDNVIDRGGITPLHIATYYSSLRAARSLITHGATVSLSTQASELALAEAISNTCIPMVDLLLSSGISLENAVDSQGGTPLMAAVCLDHVGLVRCLMRWGARGTVGARDGNGEGAWHVGARWSGVEVLGVLGEGCAEGEGVNARNGRGETPLVIAIREGRGVDVVEVLLRAGAMCHEGVEREMGRCSFEVRELLDSWFGSPGRGGRSGFVDEDEESLMSQETERPRPGDGHYDRRVARYTRRPSPEFTRSSARDASPDPSFDRMSTDFDFESSLDSLSLSEWNPNHDRRLVKRPIERYERPDFRSQKMYGGGSLFSEDWGEGFDERFGDEWGSGRSGFSSERDRRRSRGSGRGRVTSVSFTVYG